MHHTEQWIWLPKARYPDRQNTIYVGMEKSPPEGHYTVAEFKKCVQMDQEIVKVRLRFSGDTAFQLYLNGACIATGPASVGGDFLDNDRPRDKFYAYTMSVEPHTAMLDFFARVQMMPVQICEYSKGRGGFMLSAVLTLADGTETEIITDETWLVRCSTACTAPRQFDSRFAPDIFVPAEIQENIWHTETAPIPVRTETVLAPTGSRVELAPGEEQDFVLELDRIWAGFVQIRAETEGELYVRVECRELEENGTVETLVFAENGEYRSFYMHSAGNLHVSVRNASAACAAAEISFVSIYYPVTAEGETVTSDDDLNLVLDTCKHTLKICRQTHHLDSPRHCEPLACTGDYYIESLMTLFSFGDMRLAAFDVQRTAVMLERNDGRIFHTTYSLIWVRMLWDVYLATGEITLLQTCRTALDRLLKRFERYYGENGLLENPPDYMFVDWIYIDGISMHHPPKALGQTCLNLFYFGALDRAEKVYTALGCMSEAERCASRRTALRESILTYLYDEERGMFFEGLNTPTPEHLLGPWMPQNVAKRYYLKHSNILAACFGVCEADVGRDLIRKIMQNEIPGDYQPYFAHFLLEAIDRQGLRETYTRTVLEQWKKPVMACTKGLVEGFVKPEPTYSFDHSHAWGGTPLYALPKALMGLEIAEPGMKTLRLSPSLLGLAWAKTELLTPYGKVICEMKAGEAPKIIAPEEICLIMK